MMSMQSKTAECLGGPLDGDDVTVSVESGMAPDSFIFSALEGGVSPADPATHPLCRCSIDSATAARLDAKLEGRDVMRRHLYVFVTTFAADFWKYMGEQ